MNSCERDAECVVCDCDTCMSEARNERAIGMLCAFFVAPVVTFVLLLCLFSVVGMAVMIGGHIGAGRGVEYLRASRITEQIHRMEKEIQAAKTAGYLDAHKPCSPDF